MERTPKDIFIRRAAEIMDKNSPISTYPTEEDTFVVFDGRIAIGGSRITHESAAVSNRLFDPKIEYFDKLIVDDGGQIHDNGNDLVIGCYFTESTMPRLIVEAIKRDGSINMNTVNNVKKQIRTNTGQLFADITGRTVITMHDDGTKSRFLPKHA